MHENVFFFNKFLFLFLSNLQTQLTNSKKHRNFLKETNKKQTNKQKVSTKIKCIQTCPHCFITKTTLPHRLLFLFPLKSIYNRNNNNNNNNNNNRQS